MKPPALTILPLLAPPSIVDYVQSRDLAEHTEHPNESAFLRAFCARGSVDRENAYVEGLVVLHDVLAIAEHAWVERPDGSILDPDPAYCEATVPERTYFPMYRWYYTDLVIGAVLGQTTFPLRNYLPSRGRSHRDFLDATVHAWRHAFALYHAMFGETPQVADESRFWEELLGKRWTRHLSAASRDRNESARQRSRA
jgi:hypothetical protein